MDGGSIVFLTGLLLVGLGITGLVRAPMVASFFEGFAQSARAHYGEQTVRILAGLGCLGIANATAFEQAFQAFGLVLIVTSGLLMLVPWRWHRRFANIVIPMVVRYQLFYVLGALCLGAVLLAGLATSFRA